MSMKIAIPRSQATEKVIAPEIQPNGFTLLEMLLVLAILGMITALVMPKYGSSLRFSHEQARAGDRARIEGAIELYRLDTGVRPSRLEDLLFSPSAVKGWRGPYLEKMPIQPDGKPYLLDAQGKVEF